MSYQHQRANKIYHDLKDAADITRKSLLEEINASIGDSSIVDRIGAKLQVCKMYFDMIAEANRSATVIEHAEEDRAIMMR